MNKEYRIQIAEHQKNNKLNTEHRTKNAEDRTKKAEYRTENAEGRTSIKKEVK